MSRQGLAKRLAALEAVRPGDMPFILDDGRTVKVPILAVLAVFMEGLSWTHDDPDNPPTGEHSHYLKLLGHAVDTPDRSVFANSVVHIAQAAREGQSILPGKVEPE